MENSKHLKIRISYPKMAIFQPAGIVSLQEWYILKDIWAFFFGNQRFKIIFSCWRVEPTHLKHTSQIGLFPG